MSYRVIFSCTLLKLHWAFPLYEPRAHFKTTPLLSVCIPGNVLSLDLPGTESRIATISGSPEACSRAHKMVMDIIAEVKVITSST